MGVGVAFIICTRSRKRLGGVHGEKMAAYQQQSSRRLVGLERVLDKHRDFTQVYEALQSACDKSFELGLKLNLSYDEVKEIHTDHQTSQRRLCEVIAAFLERNERPTWQDIIDALNSPLVKLPALARTIDGRFSPGRLASTTSEPQPPRPSARLHLDLPDPTCEYILFCVYGFS